jgi:hypothetical protein
MVGNEVHADQHRALASAPNGASLDVVHVFGEGLQSEVLVGDTHFPGTTYLTQYPGFVDWEPGGRGWVGAFGNLSPLDPVRSHPAPALLKSGKVKLPFKSVTVLTPSIEKQSRQAEVSVLEDGPERFAIEITNGSENVDQFSWKLADWPDHSEKILDDSGVWTRRVDEEVTRIIISNESNVRIESDHETIGIRFDGSFEGRLDRTGDGWTITPDAYNAVTPKLLSFQIRRNGQVESYEAPTSQPLEPNSSHLLNRVR